MVFVALEDFGGEAEAEALGVVLGHTALGVSHELNLELADTLAGLRIPGVAIGVAISVAARARKIARFAEGVEAVTHVPLVRGHHVGEPGVAAAVPVTADGRRGDTVGAGGGGTKVRLVHTDPADFMDFFQGPPRETLGLWLVGLLARRSLRWLGTGDEVHPVINHRVGFTPVILLVGRSELQPLQVVFLQGPFHLLRGGFGTDHPDEFIGLESLDIGLEALALCVIAEIAVPFDRIDGERFAHGVAGAAEAELAIKDKRDGELEVHVFTFEFLRVIGHELGPDLDGFAGVVLRLDVGEELLHQPRVGHEFLQER